VSTATTVGKSQEEIHKLIYLVLPQFPQIQALANSLPLTLKDSKIIKRGFSSFTNNQNPSKNKRLAAPYSEKRMIHLKLSLINPPSSDSEFLGSNKTYESLLKTQ